MQPESSIVAFVVSLLVGGFGIYVGAAVIAEVRDFGRAVWTAAIGALVWAAVAVLVGDLPGLGPALTLVAWIAVVNWRYPGGWIDAGGIAAVAWVASVVAVRLLAELGVEGLTATGVPGV